MAVAAFRLSPGSFALATNRIELDLEFVCDGVEYRVVGEPTSVGYRHAIAKVRILSGPAEGREMNADLRAGDQVS